MTEPETRAFVEKNPIMIVRLENMGRASETEIMNELERRLSIKAE